MPPASPTSPALEIFTGAPPPPPPRPRVLLVGSALASGAAAMVLLALVAIYTRMRADVIAGGDTWLPEDANVQLSPGNMGMVTLLMSGVTVAWAVYSLRTDDRAHAYLAFGLSILLGVAYIPTGSKWFFGLGLVSLVLAVAYGWTTGGNGVGPLTMGYRGGVGDHLGYGLLVAAGFISLFLGSVSLAVRDADAEAVVQVAGSEAVPAAIPASPSYWPAVTAFGVALVIVGLVASPVLFVFGLLALGVVVAAFSRIFLTLSADAAVWVGIGIATVIIVAGFFFASRPRLSRNMIVAVLLVAAVAVIGVGIGGAVRGEREFHEPDDGRTVTEEGG